MFKKRVRAKVEFFDDAGEIQIVPIDTVVDDGAPICKQTTCVEINHKASVLVVSPDDAPVMYEALRTDSDPRFRDQGRQQIHQTTVEGAGHRGLTPSTSKYVQWHVTIQPSRSRLLQNTTAECLSIL